MNSSLENGTILSIIEGSNIIFSCEATGMPLPTISFILSNDRIISAPEDQPAVGRVLGTLNLTSVRGNDSGIYICLADNGAGRIAFTTFELIVQGKSLVHACSTL